MQPLPQETIDMFFKRCRALDLESGKEIAATFAVHPSQVTRWRRREQHIPPMAFVLLDALERVQQLQRELTPPPTLMEQLGGEYENEAEFIHQVMTK